MVTNAGKELRFFSDLPRYIPHDVPSYLIKYWFRRDARLEPNDILDRMEEGKGKPSSNALSKRRGDFQLALKLSS